MYGIIKSGSFDLSKPYPIDASVKFTLVGDMENKYGKYEVTLYSSNNHSNYYYEINFTQLDYPATKSYVDSLILTTLNTEV